MAFPFVNPDPLFRPPGQRASDFDRDTAVDILCAAAADGRLTLTELEDRAEAALSARTLRELALLIADLLPRRAVTEDRVSTEDRVTGEGGGPERPGGEREGAADRWALLRSVLAAAE
jgi:hypothetical protein